MTPAELPPLQIFCAATPAVLDSVKKKYGEVLAGSGPTASGKLAMLLVDPDDGSWTLVLQMPGGPMCVLAVGENWQAINPAPEESAS